jgi:hypothetical protein
MTTNRELNLGIALLALGLICGGCGKNEPAPVPTPPPSVTNVPVPAAVPEAPKPATNAPANAVADAKFLTPEQAKDHVGEQATVRGKVFGVHVSQKGDVFMNIGAAHPNAPFTAVCFQQSVPTETLKAFDGKTVSIKGKIKDYKGTIEIVLDKADQISE